MALPATGIRDSHTCRSCARDTRRHPGLTVTDERTSEFAAVCGPCLKDRNTLALNALAAWMKARPGAVVGA